MGIPMLFLKRPMPLKISCKSNQITLNSLSESITESDQLTDLSMCYTNMIVLKHMTRVHYFEYNLFFNKEFDYRIS